MHVLYVVHGYKPAYRLGGPVHSVSSLAESLVQKGHKVTVFATNCNLDQDLDIATDQPLQVDGVEVWYFRRVEYLQRLFPSVNYISQSIGYLYAPRLRAGLARVVPTVDIVHTHMPFIYPTVAAAMAARQYRRPLFYHQRGVLHPMRMQYRSAKKRLYLAAVERPIMKRANTLIALTRDEEKSYRSLGIQTRCRVIPNGIDVEIFRGRSDVKVGPAVGISDDAQVILFMGRLHPLKGVDRLLDAFLGIQHLVRKAVLVVAGPDEGGMQQAMTEKAHQAGVGGRVVFTGMIEGEPKLDLLARADIFCLPSQAEGFAMALLEAMASSTPVVISPGCGFPEVEEAGAGVVVSPSPEELGQSLLELLRDPDRSREMGRLGRDLVAAKYTWNAIGDQMLAAYADA